MPTKLGVSVEALVAAYDRLRSIDKVSDEFKISRATVARRLRPVISLDGPKTIDHAREQKLCPACGDVKSVADFHKATRRPDGLQGQCKTCSAEIGRDAHLRAKYGISAAAYDALLAEQDGRCAICGLPETLSRAGRVLQLAVDHCHASRTVRGLLCGDCNNGLGRFKDDPELLLRAAAYLKGE